MQRNNSDLNSLRPNKLIQIEKRPYDANSTPEEIELIRNRVFVHEEGIVFINEIPIVTPFSITILFDQADLIAEQFPTFGLIIDISHTNHPDALSRRKVNQRFAKICNNVSHVAFITGKNILINTSIRFVMFGTNLKSFSVNKNIESAVAAVKKKMKHGLKNKTSKN